MRRLLARCLLAALTGAAPAVAHAQPATAPPDATEPAPPPALSFALTPYAWLPALRGSVQSPLPQLDGRSVALGSGTVFTDLSTVPVMLAGEMRYGRFAFVGDLFFAGLEQDVRVGRDRLFNGGHVRAVTTFVTLLGMVSVVETPSQRLELGAGTRIWNFNNKLSLNPGLIGGAIVKSSLSWADPLLAARYAARLSPRLGVTIAGDVGGFDAGSRLTWQVQGSLDYAVTPATQVRAGWRYLNVDRTQGSTGVDLGFNGPFIATTFRF